MPLVTGGAGFIGSHLVDYLVKEGERVVVVDDLCSGDLSNIRHHFSNKEFKFIKKDILSYNLSEALEESDSLYHLAADPSVKLSSENPEKNFRLNAIATFRALEAARKSDAKEIIFTSSSTVYGEAMEFPTSEEHLLEPISNYGASKAACESYISSYAHTYGIKGVVLRLANIFGPRSTHGVIFDFFNKLRRNPNELSILGDGRQSKSYLYISDCIEAIMLAERKQKKIYDYFNVGSGGMVEVSEIAGMVCSYMGLRPDFKYSGGKRGWSGDVVKMLLGTKKIERLGWREKIPFEKGVKKYLDWLSG